MGRPRTNPDDPRWLEYDLKLGAWEKGGRKTPKPLTPTAQDHRPDWKKTHRENVKSSKLKSEALSEDTPKHVKERVKQAEREAKLNSDPETVKREARRTPKKTAKPIQEGSLLEVVGSAPRGSSLDALREFQDNCAHRVKEPLARSGQSDSKAEIMRCTDCSKVV